MAPGHGAWCWQRVARLLSRDGHDVVTPTLTGLAERSHLLTPEIGLDTHILDVVNDMKWRELTGVVLVGHSYAGLVILGVAEHMEKSIAAFVLLDAFFWSPGRPWWICRAHRCARRSSRPSVMALALSHRARRRCSTSMSGTVPRWMRIPRSR